MWITTLEVQVCFLCRTEHALWYSVDGLWHHPIVTFHSISGSSYCYLKWWNKQSRKTYKLRIWTWKIFNDDFKMFGWRDGYPVNPRPGKSISESVFGLFLNALFFVACFWIHSVSLFKHSNFTSLLFCFKLIYHFLSSI